MNLHNSAMRQLLSPFYKELSNDCDEMQLNPFCVQGSVGCVGPLVSVEFTAGEGAPTTVQNPCPSCLSQVLRVT